MIDFFIKLCTLFIFDSQKRKAFRKKMAIKWDSKNTLYEKNRRRYHIGDYSYMGVNSAIKNAEETTIGKFCSISHEVMLGLSQHPIDNLTTSTFYTSEESPTLNYSITMPKDKVISFPMSKCMPPIKVGNDVWIGYRAIVMDGITIGDGAVIAAGAVVTHDVPPYAIVAGVPAKVIKYRFSEEIIKKLENIRWWDFPIDFIVNLPFTDIEKCIDMCEKNIHLRGK